MLCSRLQVLTLMLFHQAEEASSLEEPVHLAPQTTLPLVCLLLGWGLQLQQHLLPTPPSPHSREQLAVDSTFHSLLHSILGMPLSFHLSAVKFRYILTLFTSQIVMQLQQCCIFVPKKCLRLHRLDGFETDGYTKRSINIFSQCCKLFWGAELI